MSEPIIRRRTFVQWSRRYLSHNLLVVAGVMVYQLIFSDKYAALD